MWRRDSLRTNSPAASAALRSDAALAPGRSAASDSRRFEASSRQKPNARPGQAALEAGALIFLSAAYFLSILPRAVSAPLWMDEVLAVWVARLPSLQLTLSAIWNGAEFSPPVYHLLLHEVLSATGDCCRTLAPRLPSILALYAAALCVWRLLRGRVDALVAVVGFGAVLGSALFEFALQAREYALLALLLALALLVWAGVDGARRPWLRAGGLFAALFACVSVHFYGVVAVATIATAELLWLASRRQVRWPVWTALLATGAASLVWLPLALHLAKFNAVLTHSPGFFARPSPGTFGGALFLILFGSPAGAVVAAFAGVAAAIAARARPADEARRPGLRTPPTTLEIMLLALLAAPFAAFAMALLATHAFSLRYAVPTALVSGLAAAWLLDRAPSKRLIATLLIPLLAAVIFVRPRADVYGDSRPALAAIAATRDRASPIVVGESLLFLQLMEAADAPTRARLVYVLTPPGVANPDPTNETEVIRLRTSFPDLPVRAWSELPQLGRFLLLHRAGVSTDTVTDAMIRRGVPLQAVYANGDTFMFASPGVAAP